MDVIELSQRLILTPKPSASFSIDVALGRNTLTSLLSGSRFAGAVGVVGFVAAAGAAICRSAEKLEAVARRIRASE